MYSKIEVYSVGNKKAFVACWLKDKLVSVLEYEPIKIATTKISIKLKK